VRYEDILLNFAFLSRNAKLASIDSLDSVTLSSVLQAPGGAGIPVRLSRAYPPQAFSSKRISADLDRLYRMGLLKRKRVKRMFKSKKGKEFGRGYRYQYELSEQGSKYALYLASYHGISRNERKQIRSNQYKKYDSDELVVKALVHGNAPVTSVAEIADSQEKHIPKEGICERFPIQHDSELYTRYLVERLQRGKLENKLKSIEQQVSQLQGKGFGVEVGQHETPLQLLRKARGAIAKGSINPNIYGSLTLLHFLDLAISNLEAYGHH
jgi:hypothetical protein